MKKTISKFVFALSITTIFFACKKTENTPEIIPSSGTTITFDGGTGGASASKSAFVDLSTDKASSVLRSSWDLGFYSGSDFRVIINNTTSAAAKLTTATDLAAIGEADTTSLTLAINQASPSADFYNYIDALDGNLTNTVIPAIASNDADNKVIIINRGKGGGVDARPWIKAKITRNSSGGYTLQYGTITQTTGFTSVNIAKDAAYNFTHVSFDGGLIVSVEPKKTEWDFTWSYAVSEANFGVGFVPYNFSDLVSINYLGGVTVCEKVYVDAATRNTAYTNFNKDSVTASTFTNNRWAIGSKWRSTQPATGVKTDRFFVVKDNNNNYYAVKFLSMGVNDGGVRGNPQFEYKLIK